MMRILFLALMLTAGQAHSENGEWMGHLAKTADAKIACQDINSRECEPFLAQAVGMVDYAQRAANVTDCKKMNGLDVTHVALTMDEKQYFYWSQALLVTIRSICKLP